MLALAGNTICTGVARQLGRALSSERAAVRGHQKIPSATSNGSSSSVRMEGLKLLHLGSMLIFPGCLTELLTGLGPTFPLQEGPNSASVIVHFLDGKSENGLPVLPKLNRIDMLYNKLDNQGAAKLTRAILKRDQIGMMEVLLLGNGMGSKGIKSIMNKCLQHKLVVLNLNNNAIGNQGCQLVAVSLPSTPSLSRRNLVLNDIDCRGMATLMHSLVGCKSIIIMGVLGNGMKISGVITMGFTLAQHPRLSALELYNCCISQVAQCHIVAWITSNRWFPMKVM